jgi:hypothetical protein
MEISIAPCCRPGRHPFSNRSLRARINKQQSPLFVTKPGEEKDQSYVLSFISERDLAHTLFPLGGYTKDELENLPFACPYLWRKSRKAKIYASSPGVIIGISYVNKK